MSEAGPHEPCDGRVYVGQVPQALEGRLATLYESTYSLPAYFDLFFPPSPRCAWCLSSPPHVVEFQIDGSAAVAMNGVFPIDAESLRKFCAAVFAALPTVDRIRFSNLDCDPAGLGLPFRIDRTVDDTVATLPNESEEYMHQLGYKTRRNLRNYIRKLERIQPEYGFRLDQSDAIRESLVSDIVELNRQRFKAKGGRSGIDDVYEQRLQRLLQSCGLVGSLTIGDALVAGLLATRVGNSVYLHVTGHLDDYADLHPGFVNIYLTINACIELGVHTVHFLWGGSEYKRWLGGITTRDLYFATVFRSAGSRYRHPGEEAASWLVRARTSSRPLVGWLRWKARHLIRSPNRHPRR